MTELEQYIRSYFGVGQENLQLIVSLFSEHKIKKGEFLLKSGKQCDKLCFIKTGLVRIYVSMEDREVTQWISTKGYFVTDLASLIFDTPARWTIQALSDAELFMIKKEDYQKIGERLPQWHQLEKLFLARCFTIMEDRIFTHLSMTADERYHHFFEHNKELFNQVPLQYLASMLGMTPETFSRIRSKS